MSLKVAILGAGWPGKQHARGYLSAGGFKIVAVADLIPDRRKALMTEFSITREFANAEDALKDPEIEAVSICLPNHLHMPIAIEAFKAGKHVLCETPPILNSKEAKKIAAASKKYGKTILFALQRRFGPNEQAAKAAIAKGLIGTPLHIRAAWTRTRGLPAGTGWYSNPELSGGGALIDVGLPMLDLAWHLLGQPQPAEISGAVHTLLDNSPVEDSAFALIRFETGQSIELSASWLLNQPASSNGAVCRVHGTEGAIDVYTPAGATLYQQFDPKGQYKENPLKPPKLVHYTALCRHFRDCALGNATPMIGPDEAISLLDIIQQIYKNAR